MTVSFRPRAYIHPSALQVTWSDRCQLCCRHISSPLQPHPWLGNARAAAHPSRVQAVAADVVDGAVSLSSGPSRLPKQHPPQQAAATAGASPLQRPLNQPDMNSIPWLRRRRRNKRKKIEDLQADVKVLQLQVERAAAQGEEAKVRVLKRAVSGKLRSQQQLKKCTQVSSSQVAVGVEQLCQALEVPLDTGLRMAERCDQLVLRSPASTRQRVETLAVAVGGSYQDALQLAIIRPSLLLYSPNTIQRNITHLTQLFNVAKGSPLLQMLTQRPELLTAKPASIAAKLSEFAFLLSVSESRASSVVVSCPRLLRSSAPALQSKFKKLKKLLAIPASTLAELLLREPRLLVMGSTTMQRKLQALLFKFAMFEDEVVDMLLADPSVLMSDDLTSYEMDAMMASQPASSSLDLLLSQSPDTPYAPPSSSGLPALRLPSPALKPPRKKSTLVDPITLLCRVLGVPVEQGVLLLATHGEVLGSRTAERLRGEVTQLAAMLGVAYADAAAMVCSQPGLLAWSAAQQPAPLTPLPSSPSPEEAALNMEDDMQREVTLSQFAADVEGGVALQESLTQPESEWALRQSLSLSQMEGEGELQQTLTQLKDLLAVDESSLRTLFTQVPDLLTEPRTAIASRLKRLQDALGVSATRATQVAIKAPQLLQDPNSLGAAGNMRVLQDVLGISMSQVSELVCREPQLLVVSPSEIRQRFEALAARFGLFQDDAIDVVMADPSILLRLADEQFEF